MKFFFLILFLIIFSSCENSPAKNDSDTSDMDFPDIDTSDKDYKPVDNDTDIPDSSSDDLSDPDISDDDTANPCNPNPCDIENSTGECVEKEDTFECVCEENYIWDGKKCVSIPKKVYVDKNAKGLNNGTSWQDAYASLQKAIDESEEGSEIWVAKGVYKPSGFPQEGTIYIPDASDPDYPRYRHFSLRNEIAVYGGFNGTEGSREQRNVQTNETILSGDMDDDKKFSDNDIFHVVVNVDLESSAIIDGFTITGGNANLDKDPQTDHHEQHGGGMFNQNSALEIYNCSFVRNYAVISGGGMENRDSGLYIENSIFQNNVSFRGGGMNNDVSSPRVYKTEFKNNTTVNGYGGGVFNDAKSRGFFNECVFSGNTSEDGAAMSNNVFSDVRISDCVFENNVVSRNGGAITNSQSNPVIWFSTFKGNTSVSGGGAIENYSDSEPKIVGCRFFNNEVTGLIGDGGAILTTTGRPVIVSSVFYDNSAPGGGAVANRDTTAYIINSTFVNNTADPVSGYGGAIYSQTDSVVYLINSIVRDNSAFEGNDIYNEQADMNVFSSNISGSFSGDQWNTDIGDNKGGNIDSNPSFSDEANKDFSLKSESVCVDKGDNTEYETGGIVYSFQEDIDQNPRIVNDTVDMGAWEFQE